LVLGSSSQWNKHDTLTYSPISFLHHASHLHHCVPSQNRLESLKRKQTILPTKFAFSLGGGDTLGPMRSSTIYLHCTKRRKPFGLVKLLMQRRYLTNFFHLRRRFFLGSLIKVNWKSNEDNDLLCIIVNPHTYKIKYYHHSSVLKTY
jgi:hypothetical protein